MSDTLTRAAHDVLQERSRQVLQEGWTPEHDDEHAFGQMALAAASYCLSSVKRSALRHWPWNVNWFKPTTPRRDLVKAGALILAEIERLDRMEEQG